MNSEHFSGHRGATEAECIAGPARKPRSAMGTSAGAPEVGPNVCGPSRHRAGPVLQRARRPAPQPAPPGSELGLLRASRAGGDRVGGGGRGGERVVASAATVGEERRLALLWRRTRGGGGGDPPLSTWTVAEVSADTFASGRGGRTALAAAAVAAAAERSGGPGGA